MNHRLAAKAMLYGICIGEIQSAWVAPSHMPPIFGDALIDSVSGRRQ